MATFFLFHVGQRVHETRSPFRHGTVTRIYHPGPRATIWVRLDGLGTVAFSPGGLGLGLFSWGRFKVMDSAVINALVNAGFGGIILILMLLGWLVPKWVYSRLLEENRLLREALELERQRNSENSSQMGIANQLLSAVVDLAEARKAPREKSLTWKDVSL